MPPTPRVKEFEDRFLNDVWLLKAIDEVVPLFPNLQRSDHERLHRALGQVLRASTVEMRDIEVVDEQLEVRNDKQLEERDDEQPEEENDQSPDEEEQVLTKGQAGKKKGIDTGVPLADRHLGETPLPGRVTRQRTTISATAETLQHPSAEGSSTALIRPSPSENRRSGDVGVVNLLVAQSVPICNRLTVMQRLTVLRANQSNLFTAGKGNKTMDWILPSLFSSKILTKGPAASATSRASR